MRTRTIVWQAALPVVVALTAALVVGLAVRPAAGGTTPLRIEQTGVSQDGNDGSRGKRQERFLYVATIAQSSTDPDFVAVIGADPRRPDFGKIVNRIDMPNVGDELHHFGYSADQDRLIVPGLFSNRIHIFDIGRDGKTMSLRAVNDQLASKSGYIVPHSVISTSHGRTKITMIGSATGPKYMYDFDSLVEANRGISTTFGPPALCGGGIDPTCLGGEISVWNLRRQKVIQIADLGTHSGALEVRFIEQPGVERVGDVELLHRVPEPVG